MLTTGQMRKFIIPRMIEEVGSLSKGMELTAKDRYGMFFDDKDTPGLEYVELHSDECVAEASLLLEGAEYDEVDPKDGHSFKVHQHQYGAGFSFTKPVRKFQRKDLIGKATRDLGKTPIETYANVAISMIELGNGGTVPAIRGVPLVYAKSMDKKNIFATDHGFLSNGGVTNSNYIASTALSESALNTIGNTPYAWLGSNGEPMRYRVEYLIIPYQLRHAVAKYLKSTQQADSANNAYNTVNEDFKSGDYRVCQDLTSATSYYAKTNAAQRPKLRHAWRPETTRGKDINTNCDKVVMDFSFSAEVANWAAFIRIGDA